MVIVVDGDSVRLDAPEDLKGFKVVVASGDEASAGRALASVGRMIDRETAWVRAGAVRALAHGRVDGDWDDGFDAMLGYAASKGWLSDDGSEIQAHVEWPEA